MATRVKLTSLERRILDAIYLSPNGFERVEDLHDALGADQVDFVDALETLEGDGYLSVSNLGGAIVVALDDPVAEAMRLSPAPSLSCSARVGQC